MNQKDIKLLWGRAGNRCSICRIELSQDSRCVNASFNLGEQAHIVGEKDDAPRGKSPLTSDERNTYHNIILLCPNHHTEIDRNEADWPIEKLYQIKSQHELWVKETLSDATDLQRAAKQIAVTSIIDAAVDLCEMENWKGWASGALAVTPYWPSDLPDKIFAFRQKVAATIWPEEYDELKRATITLANFIHRASTTFMEHAEDFGGSYRAIKFYKRDGLHNPNYDEDGEKYDLWIEDCYRLVKEATRSANWFADIVRRDINPMFFASKGRFLIEEGPFEDLQIHASIPEFSATQKATLPDSMSPKNY